MSREAAILLECLQLLGLGSMGSSGPVCLRCFTYVLLGTHSPASRVQPLQGVPGPELTEGRPVQGGRAFKRLCPVLHGTAVP